MFGNYDIVKSKVEVDLKMASNLKKTDKMVKKLKAKLGESVDEEEEVKRKKRWKVKDL